MNNERRIIKILSKLDMRLSALESGGKQKIQPKRAKKRKKIVEKRTSITISQFALRRFKRFMRLDHSRYTESAFRHLVHIGLKERRKSK